VSERTPSLESETNPPFSLKGHIKMERTDFGLSLQLQDANSTIALEMPTAANSPSKPWTFQSWLQWDGQPAIVLSSQDLRPDPSSSNYGRGLAIEITEEGKVAVMLGARLPAYVLHTTTAEKLKPQSWSHLHVTYDGSGNANGVSISINGS